MQDRIERVVPVQKAGGSFRRNERVYLDPDLGLATPDAEHFRDGVSEPVKHPLVALAAADARPSDFTVDCRVPVAQDGDLRVVQLVNTGRETADGRAIVRPILVKRNFKPGDRPDLDRHPVEFLEERDRQLQQNAAPPAALQELEPPEGPVDREPLDDEPADLEGPEPEPAPPAADAK